MHFKYTTCEDTNRCLMDSELFGTHQMKTTIKNDFLIQFDPARTERIERPAMHDQGFLLLLCGLGCRRKGFCQHGDASEKRSKILPATMSFSDRKPENSYNFKKLVSSL